ncbi:MAG: ribosomal subunit interface protein [Rickettsiales bacterium]|jgi:ribosomal subunit interface protein
MEIGEALTKHAKENLEKHVNKYFDTAINADVHFSKQNSRFYANIVINEGMKKGIVIKSDGNAEDPYGCFNEAMERAAKQLRRYKRKIKNYRRERGGLKSVELIEKGYDALKYIISADPYPSFEESEEEESFEVKPDDKLNIVTEKNTDIEELSVQEAIMKMNLADLPALVFINSDNKRLNVVYNRKDGNISWIDPETN